MYIERERRIVNGVARDFSTFPVSIAISTVDANPDSIINVTNSFPVTPNFTMQPVAKENKGDYLTLRDPPSSTSTTRVLSKTQCRLPSPLSHSIPLLLLKYLHSLSHSFAHTLSLLSLSLRTSPLSSTLSLLFGRRPFALSLSLTPSCRTLSSSPPHLAITLYHSLPPSLSLSLKHSHPPPTAQTVPTSGAAAPYSPTLFQSPSSGHRTPTLTRSLTHCPSCILFLN
jgi:hypothetical protein